MLGNNEEAGISIGDEGVPFIKAINPKDKYIGCYQATSLIDFSTQECYQCPPPPSVINDILASSDELERLSRVLAASKLPSSGLNFKGTDQGGQ